MRVSLRMEEGEIVSSEILDPAVWRDGRTLVVSRLCDTVVLENDTERLGEDTVSGPVIVVAGMEGWGEGIISGSSDEERDPRLCGGLE